MAGKTIIILGAGVGGLVAANEIRRRLTGEHRIVLVEKNPQHAFAPSFLWLMTGDRQPSQISRDVHQLVRPGIEVILEEALGIDLTKRRVQTHTQTLTYDYLILALGADLAPEAIPGLKEGAQTYYTLEGAKQLNGELSKFGGGKVAVVVSSIPYKCPGAPHEGAMLLMDYLHKHDLGEKSEVHLFTPEAQPMPVAGPVLGDAVKQMLADAGVFFHPLHKLMQVDANTHQLVFEGNEPFQYNLLVAVPPHHGPRIAKEAGLANETGWIPVDRSTLRTPYEGVYALGDATAIPIPGRWKPDMPLMLPKAGVFAHAQAEVVARQITADIMGKDERSEFPGIGYCMLEAGESLAGFAFGNFFAEPSPQIELRKISKTWHVGKVLIEQWWLQSHGLRRDALHLALTLGSKALGIPLVL
ncbi:MAG: hypothetical protein A2136_02655 [Chloroflexi bacterium RBG_16_54_11]|nr:MAG: hypothetical protein A2136_02655 [Chloroflexi bacterium RBG_16_54_11]